MHELGILASWRSRPNGTCFVTAAQPLIRRKCDFDWSLCTHFHLPDGQLRALHGLCPRHCRQGTIDVGLTGMSIRLSVGIFTVIFFW